MARYGANSQGTNDAGAAKPAMDLITPAREPFGQQIRGGTLLVSQLRVQSRYVPLASEQTGRQAR